MKIVAFSDPHGEDISDAVPECDVLCIAGDLSPNKESHTYGTQRRWFHNKFARQLERYRERAKDVIFVAGNHDRYLFECHQAGKTDEEVRARLGDRVHYLVNESVSLGGVNFHGNPWCNCPQWAEPGAPVWNFASKNLDFLGALHAGIPLDTDVVLTHGPAYGFCDQILDQGVLDLAAEAYGDGLKAEHLGCQVLGRRLRQLAAEEGSRLRYVLSGHIHSAAHGLATHQPPGRDKPVAFYGVSILNEQYARGAYAPLELLMESRQ